MTLLQNNYLTDTNSWNCEIYLQKKYFPAYWFIKMVQSSFNLDRGGTAGRCSGDPIISQHTNIPH